MEDLKILILFIINSLYIIFNELKKLKIIKFFEIGPIELQRSKVRIVLLIIVNISILVIINFRKIMLLLDLTTLKEKVVFI